MSVRERGFSLLEVLVALTVLTVALGALIKAGSDHARNTQYLRERTLAHWAGQNLLAEYEAGLRPASAGHSGEVEMGPLRLAFRVEVSNYSPQAVVALPPVRRIDVRVWPAGTDESRQLAQVSGFVLP
ncbi:MAG: type II secretion system minor pseudopilin GspI [Halopseudomonas yangmingensis]|uniref:Type II secretion system protein I n=1 Tax=Halopseudomonas yangmingensis TaxID=1720063 RepID=A0A1I4U6T3_9GAMM|nr:type II secretion system minor pseudopilin GspI [Halopseudomonas yangmingensis]SFM84692.1 general secretion pathway protein I [Halopseudomonas yangmingensis]